MEDRPSATDLLEIARTTLLEAFLPHIPAELRLEALIAANVLAITAREAAFGETPLRHERARLAAIYDAAVPPIEESAALAAEARRLRARLAADIRAGAFEADPARLDQVREHLVATTLQRLRINNPRYLEAEGLS